MDSESKKIMLEEAFEKYQFQVYYQPKYDLHTEMVTGAEALVRWQHPQNGILSAGEFLGDIKEAGLMNRLDTFVWNTVCKDISYWMNQGYPPVAISVNVIGDDLFWKELAEVLLNATDQYQIPANFLHLEITEDAYQKDPVQTKEIVNQLRKLGFVIEIDNFGKNFSSLNMLIEMNVDVLKMDMNYIQKETERSAGKSVLNFVINLAKWNKLIIVAEGVESPEQIYQLRSMDCNYVQGFYYAKPMPAEQFVEILKTSAVAEIFDHARTQERHPTRKERILKHSRISRQRVNHVLASRRLQKMKLQELDEDGDTIIENQLRYRYILDNLDVAFFEFGEKGEFYASDKFSLYAMSSVSQENLLNNGGELSSVYPDDIPVLFDFFNRKNKKESKVSVTLRLKMKDGSYRFTEMMGFFEYDENGRRVRTTGVLRDVDQEWLQQNRRLQDALDIAEKANQAKTDFLARVSHDMRTPLNGILGITRLMRYSNLDAESKKELEQLEQSGEYLLHLIDDTLDVRRIESGHLELHPTVCDGKTAFQNVLAMVKPGIRAKNIEFKMQADNLPFTKLYIDIGRVQQAVMNVLSNAIKFTPEGGTITLIMENVSIKGDIITDRIIIRDTGIGMSEEFQKTLFEPFSQERNDSKSIYHGTGLGMTISKQCMELMGGSIEVNSKEGVGTEVTLILPMKIATEEQIAEWKHTNSQINDQNLLKSKHILLCEDHPLNAAIAMKLLNKKGVIVEHASNGQVGVDMFSKSNVGYYDAILMDIRMPVMDGLEATRQIRNMMRQDAEYIPIIAMTANALSEDVKKAINAGMTEHLGKPIEPERLFKTLIQLIDTPKPYVGKKILIVDDIAMNRDFVKKAISSTYQIVEAGNGVEALDILHKEKDIVAVITDIQMPMMDGKELIRNIRSDEKLRHLAVLANTIYGDHRQEDELLSLGANDFVYKPSSAKVLMMRLEHILRHI